MGAFVYLEEMVLVASLPERSQGVSVSQSLLSVSIPRTPLPHCLPLHVTGCPHVVVWHSNLGLWVLASQVPDPLTSDPLWKNLGYQNVFFSMSQ